MIIDNYNLNETSKTFIIAEIGMNHNGNIKNAKRLIDIAIQAGADCVKFQLRNLSELYTKEALDISNSDLSTQYTVNLLKKFQLKKNEYKHLSEYAADRNIIFMCTPWDKSSADYLSKIKIPAYKIASADLTNFDLLEHVAKKKKPMIISTGMSTHTEIKESVNFLKNIKADFALLHCNSTYPAPTRDINLLYMKQLRKYNVIVGYSGHERGIAVSLAAVALGAKIIERHITLDKNMEGPDHLASLELDEFKALVRGIREIEQAKGGNSERSISQGEYINRENLSKSIFAKRNIKKNTIFDKNMFEIKSPGHGLNPSFLSKIIKKKSNRNIAKGDVLYPSDLTRQAKTQKYYKFNRPWAIPVRYHDINKLLNITNPDMVEFHLSYDDLKQDISKYLKRSYDCDFLVHAPELFENDHLLDMCSDKQSYLKKSISHMNNIIRISLKIMKYFPSSIKPKIIVNCGGFSKDDFIDIKTKKRFYSTLTASLNALKMRDKVEILPQTMAPYPWHFGGQRYQNLFMDPIEIINFCKKSKMKICHDISHSYLACNKFKWNHAEYTKTIAPYVAHYHIADASGFDGEGLRIGEGDINFSEIFKIINKYSPKASFIPEIWQGHKNNGEEFWNTLSRFENKL